ncbi:unnamed protein product [Closterium sp. NIES-53]
MDPKFSERRDSMFRVSPKPPADQCQSQATVTPSQQFAKGSPKSSARAAVSSCVSLPRLFALLVVLGCAGLWPAFLRNAANHADRGANSGDTVSESSDSLGMPNGFFTVFGGPSAIRGGFSARQLMEMTSEGASRGGGRREGGTMLTWRDDVAIAEGQTEMGEGGKEEGAGESAMAEGEAEGEHAEGGEERANPASPSIAPDAALATAFHAREQGADKAPEALRAASGDEEAAREAEGAERGVGMGDGRREGGEGGERGGEGGKEGSVDGRRDGDDRGEMGVGEGERRGLGGGEGEGQGGGEGGGNGGGERGKGGKEGEEREGVVRGKGGEWGWRWVDEKDASWPLYSAASCPFIFPGQNCRSNGRNDTRFERYAWRQGGERSGDGREDWGVREEVGGKERSWCDALRGVRHGRGEGAMTPNGMMTRVAYIGDSVMRNMFESMAHGGGVGGGGRGGGRGGGGRPMTRVAYIGDSMMRNMFESMACMLHSHPQCGDNPEVVRANVVERVIRWDTCNVTLANLR